MLRKGHTGQDVADVQELLRQSGASLTVDGVYGPSTQRAVSYFQSTHLGEDGEWLTVDGIVGPNTLWALRNPSGDLQRSRILAEIPAGLSVARDRVMQHAVHEWEIGVKEVPDGSNTSSSPEGGIEKYTIIDKGRYEKPAPWCMRFAKWCLLQTVNEGNLSDAPFADLRGGGSVSRTYESAVSLSASSPSDIWFKEGGTYTPRPGDMALMGGLSHVALVLRVSDRRINTIEGNSGNRVKCGIRNRHDIFGYINVFDDRNSTPMFEYGVFDSERTKGLSTR